jgi:iron complex outermembrane receptor protein
VITPMDQEKTANRPFTICFLLVALAWGCLADERTALSVIETESIPPQSGKQRLLQLMEMEVTTVSRTESTVGESAAAVFVITAEMIRRSGATTIPELFRMVPGLNVARIDGNKWAINARGFNDRFANKLLVQIDGRTLYNVLFSGTYWDTVNYPLEDIERIEVIRGPGASVWGANAVNGVINIITKSSRDTQGGLGVAGGGTEERGFGTFRYGDQVKENVTSRVYGSYFNRDEQYAVAGNADDAWWGGGAGARIDWNATDRDLVTVQGDYARTEAGRRDTRPQITAPFLFTNVEDEVTREGNLLGRWTRRLQDDSRWTLQAYWDRFERDSGNEILISQYDIFDLDFQHQFAWNEGQQIVYGFGYRFVDSSRRESFDDGFTFGFDDLTRRTHLFSFFLQDEITLVPDRLRVLLGSKLEHNDHSGFEVQPTTRLTWTPTRKQMVWCAVSRAVRTPSINEDNSRLTYLPFSGTSTFLQSQPSPEMEAEDLLAYELGYRAQATDRFSFDLALFYNDYRNLRSTRTEAPMAGPGGTTLIPLFFDNELRGETVGIEPAVKWQLTDWWQLYAAYSYLQMQLHRSDDMPASVEAPEGQSPRQQLFLQSSWTLPAHIELDLMGRFVDRLSGFDPTGGPNANDSVDRYVSFDVRVAWRPNHNLEVAVVGQNMLDDHHQEFGTNPFIRSPIVEIQRSIYGKITWRF